MADVVKMSLVSSKEDVAKWPDESAARRDQRRESPSISNQTKAPPAFVDTKLQEYPIENDEPEASVKESQHLRFDSFGFGMHSGLPSGFLNDDDYPFNYLNTRDGEYHEEEEQRLWNNVANDQTEPTQADQSHVWYHHGSVNKLDVIRAASKADRAPGRLRVTPVTVANMQIIRVAAVGISKFGTSIAILFGSFVIQKKKITVKDSTKQGDHVDDSDRLCTFIFGSLPRPPEARCVFLFQPSSSRGRMSVSSLFLTSSDSA